jgi:hypothetical protein
MRLSRRFSQDSNEHPLAAQLNNTELFDDTSDATPQTKTLTYREGNQKFSTLGSLSACSSWPLVIVSSSSGLIVINSQPLLPIAGLLHQHSSSDCSSCRLPVPLSWVCVLAVGSELGGQSKGNMTT